MCFVGVNRMRSSSRTLLYIIIIFSLFLIHTFLFIFSSLTQNRIRYAEDMSVPVSARVRVDTVGLQVLRAHSAGHFVFDI